MAKCTGMRCPMQVGYKVAECNDKDCIYRTEPVTNADRIRAMSDDNLAYFLAYSWATSARAWQKDYWETLRWLQKEENVDNESTDI